MDSFSHVLTGLHSVPVWELGEGFCLMSDTTFCHFSRSQNCQMTEPGLEAGPSEPYLCGFITVLGVAKLALFLHS